MVSTLASGGGDPELSGMALFGSRATVAAQLVGRPEAFAAAFAYLDEVFRSGSEAGARLAGLAPGQTHRVELEGALALEQVYLTKPRAEGFFESHRRFIDVQAIVAGAETMEVIDRSRIAASQPYDDERDFLKYSGTDGASRLVVAAGDVAVFFPDDVHMPSLRAGAEAQPVYKVVIKVPVQA